MQGAIWPELNSGRAGYRHGRYFLERQLHTGEAVLRPLSQEELGPEESYWSVASRAGRRVAAIDINDAARNPDFNGIQLTDWGLHDRTRAAGSSPGSLLADIRASHGDHPVSNCDHYSTDDAGYRRLLENLVDGVRRRKRLVLDLLSREDWDLFALTFSESHCAGHHFWHFHDPNAPWYRTDGPDDLKGAVLAVYREIDDAVGKIIEAAGNDANVLLFTSHGMGPYTAGYQLVPEVLARLGMGSDEGRANDSWLRRANNALKYIVPMSALPLVYRIAGVGVVRSLQDRSGCLVNPLQSTRTRAIALPNNRTGAIRLNLVGREPFGRVQPGNEASALSAEIADEFRALVLPGTKTPIVEWVRPVDEIFGPDHHPDLPDILVRFRHDLGILEACESPRLGRVRVAINRAYNPRTGDHTPESRLWLRSTAIADGQDLPPAHALDIAPTVLRLLDVPVPNWMDGRPLPAVS
ncbi:MAG: hypothetical protein GY791_19920 [Alphaproteobacteria bacterium]|nr:hypothetical protein [Alphaproteobacteria bacterium]